MKGGEILGNYVFVPIVSDSSAESIINQGILAITRPAPYNRVCFGITSGVAKINYYQGGTGSAILFGTNLDGQVVHCAYDYNGSVLTEDITVSEFTVGNVHAKSGWVSYDNTFQFIIDSVYTNKTEAARAMDDAIWSLLYPINYHYNNATVSGPAEVAVGDTVTVSAVPDENYGITDAASQILVTNNDVAVPYVWDSATNTITFTMPDPS